MTELLGIATMDSKGRAAIPQHVRRELGLNEGVQLRIERDSDGRIELVPAELIPRDQLYFHSPEMHARIARAEQSFADGTSTRTDGEAETQALLDSLKAP